jgi:hypothetical protein
MTDELERQLRERLHQVPLPPAPAGLHEQVDRLPSEPPGRRPPATRGLVLAAAALGLVLLAVLGAGLVSLAAPSPSLLPSPATPTPSPSSAAETPSTPSASSDVSPAPTSSAAPWPSPSLGDLGDLHVYSVSELLAARQAGAIGGEQVALRGYWTGLLLGHSCVPPRDTPGDLELYCHDGEWGVTERDEPIMTVTRGGDVYPPAGPALTPYIDQDDHLDIMLWLFTLPTIAGQPYPPVPIVLVGHFDDPRAADCRPEAQQHCRDRLVIDRLVSFEPDAVALPTPTPTPTPFPPADPPPALFSKADCAGDRPYSFIGWTTLGDLGIDIGDTQAHSYVMITRDVMQIGDWIGDPNGSQGRFRTMGQRVCYAFEWESGTVGFTWMPGTAYQEWEDGHRTPLTP